MTTDSLIDAQDELVAAVAGYRARLQAAMPNMPTRYVDAMAAQLHTMLMSQLATPRSVPSEPPLTERHWRVLMFTTIVSAWATIAVVVAAVWR